MHKTRIMINGLPGNVACIVANAAVENPKFEIIPHALTGPEIKDNETIIGDLKIELVKPDKRDELLRRLKDETPPFIIVDYTHPSAVNANAKAYCRAGVPFVMGTTGGDRDMLVKAVEEWGIPAVIAPNMAKQIVGFQAMLDFAAVNFPDVFKGYSLTIKESHQRGKADVSGTAKAVAELFQGAGADFSESSLHSERDPEIQKNQWKIPAAHLAGHGWHTYTLLSEDGDVKFEFTHNINGRAVYAQGTLDAVLFLAKKIEKSEKGRVWSMIDVLKG